jgi:hypothetical protein
MAWYLTKQKGSFTTSEVLTAVFSQTTAFYDVMESRLVNRYRLFQVLYVIPEDIHLRKIIYALVYLFLARNISVAVNFNETVL